MLEKKTAFITGCNRGIGKEICIKFLQNGANLICAVRNYDRKLEELFVSKKKNYSQTISFIELDLSDTEQMEKSINNYNFNKIKIDILINNAAVAHGSIFEMTKLSTIKEIFEVNFFSQLKIIQMLLRSLKKSNSACIINIGSISGLIAERGTIAYGSSKAALMFASKILANELSAYNIRVNSIAPNLIDTDMMNKLSTESKEKLIKLSFQNRMGTVEEVSNLVLFLSSDKSTYINGTTLNIDGGYIV
jgi:3-oxoacyl-[acyl-carrier protein] reductase